MTRSWATTLVMVAFALICIVSGGLTSNAASALPARTSDEGGVKVVVTPRVLNAGAKGWEFDLVMDTHTKPLSENLAQVAVLLDDSGRRYVPAAWEGDPPGGHHRKGVLRFAAPAEMPATIELQIAGVGGVAIRSFRWDLK